jgi:orotidine-5'-phosphate decarboxylase
VAVLERVITGVRQLGALALLDVKRGDIGSTAQGYADAYLDPRSPLACDAMTASPYLGFGSLAPMLDTAERHGAGVFVLALTSNPEGAEVQQARTGGGASVAGAVLTALARRNAGATPLGSHGAVVGATIEPPEESLEINGPLLVPGVGAQGGTVESVRAVFGSATRSVVPATSRAVLAAGPDPARLRAAAASVNDAFGELVR